MPNDMPKGLTRVETLQVVHDDNEVKTYVALYAAEDGRMSALVDAFRDDAWTSIYLPPEVTEATFRGMTRVKKRIKEGDV